MVLGMGVFIKLITSYLKKQYVPTGSDVEH